MHFFISNLFRVGAYGVPGGHSKIVSAPAVRTANRLLEQSKLSLGLFINLQDFQYSCMEEAS